MKQFKTLAIVLRRIDYGEADRIITILTPDHGKLTMMARGARRSNSKLAGGIEQLSINEFVFMQGKGNMERLISSQLVKHFGNIVKNIDATMLAYELIKLLHKTTEEVTDAAYYHLIEQMFYALNQTDSQIEGVRIWFFAQMLALGGHTPNLTTTVNGERLVAEKTYEFDYDTTSFAPKDGAPFKSNEIKFLRLIFKAGGGRDAFRVPDFSQYVETCRPLIVSLRQLYLPE